MAGDEPVTDRAHNVFVACAAADRETAAEIAAALQRARFGVWFDDFELNVGDSISRSVEAAMVTSAFGVLVVSQEFLRESWPQQMVGALRRLDKRLLPVLHGVDDEEVAREQPLLADLQATSTADGVDAAVMRLASAMIGEFAGIIGAVPDWEDPINRFLRGRGELRLFNKGGVFTLWELLLDDRTPYPAWIGGHLYERNDFLQHALYSLGGARQEASLVVTSDGVERLRREIHDWAGIDPFELG